MNASETGIPGEPGAWHTKDEGATPPNVTPEFLGSPTWARTTDLTVGGGGRSGETSRGRVVLQALRRAVLNTLAIGGTPRGEVHFLHFRRDLNDRDGGSCRFVDELR